METHTHKLTSENKMKNIIIIVLSCLVLGFSGFFIYKNLDEGMSQTEIDYQFDELKSEYKFLQKDLEKSINKIYASNQIILSQKKKIEYLLRKNQITEEELFEAKKILTSISKEVVDKYEEQVKYLQQEKKLLSQDIDQKEEKVSDLNEKLHLMEASKRNLQAQYKKEKKESDKKSALLNYAALLSVSNFNVKSYKVRKSGKEVETNKASRVDRVKINFELNENPLSESGRKELYVIATKPDGTLAIFESNKAGIFVQNGKSVPYSDKIIINYEKNKSNPVDIEWNDTFQSGEYTINLYENTGKRFAKIGGGIKKLE